MSASSSWRVSFWKLTGLARRMPLPTVCTLRDHPIAGENARHCREVCAISKEGKMDCFRCYEERHLPQMPNATPEKKLTADLLLQRNFGSPFSKF